VRDQVSHPYKTTGNNMVLYVLTENKGLHTYYTQCWRQRNIAADMQRLLLWQCAGSCQLFLQNTRQVGRRSSFNDTNLSNYIIWSSPAYFKTKIARPTFRTRVLNPRPS
jgi:hypothetical protein